MAAAKNTEKKIYVRVDVKQVRKGFVLVSRTVPGGNLDAVPEDVKFLTRGMYIRTDEEVQVGDKLRLEIIVRGVERPEVGGDDQEF
jgi:hypothetical protein